MIFSGVSLLFAGYLASSSRGLFAAAEQTAVLLGGPTESYPCDVEIGDITVGDATVLNGEIVGCGGPGNNARNCYKLEGMNNWVEIESMYEGRSGFTLTTLGDKMLAAGGYTNTGRTDSMELYDGTWSGLLPLRLTSERDEHCAVALSEHEVLIIGGGIDDSQGYNDIATVEIYDINLGVIKELPKMPTSRMQLACTMLNGEVWVAGGRVGRGNPTGRVEIFNLSTQTWRVGPSLNWGRMGLTMEAVDGELIVFGGIGAPPGSMETYKNGAWINIEETLEYGGPASVVIECF